MSVRTAARRIVSTVAVATALTGIAAPAFAGAGPGAPTPEQLQAMLNARTAAPSCTKLFYKGTKAAPTEAQLWCNGTVLKFPVSPDAINQPYTPSVTQGDITLDFVDWAGGELRVWYTNNGGTASTDDDLQWVAIRNLSLGQPTQVRNIPTIVAG